MNKYDAIEFIYKKLFLHEPARETKNTIRQRIDYAISISKLQIDNGCLDEVDFHRWAIIKYPKLENILNLAPAPKIGRATVNICNVIYGPVTKENILGLMNENYELKRQAEALKAELDILRPRKQKQIKDGEKSGGIRYDDKGYRIKK